MIYKFHEQITNMTFAEIVRSMVGGLRNEHIHIDITSEPRYGEHPDRKSIFGVPMVGINLIGKISHNTVIEITKKHFFAWEFKDLSARAKVIDSTPYFLHKFENAIDQLARTSFSGYDQYANIGKFELSGIKTSPDWLPYIWSDYGEDVIKKWEKFVKILK